jgi:hypothetical protein
VESSSDFNKYLIDSGYAYKIQYGTHKLKKGMSYAEIAYICSLWND